MNTLWVRRLPRTRNLQAQLSACLSTSSSCSSHTHSFSTTTSKREHIVDLDVTEYPTLKDSHFRHEKRHPLIIIHGLLGSSSNFKTFGMRPEIAKNRRVLALDLRNHGRSPHHDSMDTSDLAKDVTQVMDRLGIEKAVILGHSLGGKVAIAKALSEKDRVSGLIVADVAPVAYPKTGALGSSHSILQAMSGLKLEEVKDRLHASKLLEKDISSNLIRQFILQNLIHDEKGGWKWRVNLDVLLGEFKEFTEFDWPGYLDMKGAFHGPTQFISGTKSDYIKDEHHPVIKEFFPNAVLHAIQDAGHWVHADKLDAFSTVVARFMDREYL